MQSPHKPLPFYAPNPTVKQTVQVMRGMLKAQYFTTMISDFPEKKNFWQRYLTLLSPYVEESLLPRWFFKVEKRYRDQCNKLIWIPRNWERVLIFADAMAQTLLECESVAQQYREKQQNEGANDLRMLVLMDIIPQSSFEYLERVGAIPLLCDSTAAIYHGTAKDMKSRLPV